MHSSWESVCVGGGDGGVIGVLAKFFWGGTWGCQKILELAPFSCFILFYDQILRTLPPFPLPHPVCIYDFNNHKNMY